VKRVGVTQSQLQHCGFERESLVRHPAIQVKIKIPHEIRRLQSCTSQSVSRSVGTPLYSNQRAIPMSSSPAAMTLSPVAQPLRVRRSTGSLRLYKS